jgi:hypothetical protein
MNRFDHNLTREELIDLFWQSDAPEALSKFASIHRCFFYERAPIKITYEPDDLLDLSMANPKAVHFTLSGQPFGATLYIAVVCDDQIIVPPFPLEQREDLPNMFPSKEAPRAASPANTAAALEA